MAAEHPPPFIHLPEKTHKTTLIFLHGTSQTGPEIAEILLYFPIPTSPEITKILPDLLPDTKFVFPTGSPKATTVLGGKTTNSWFDIHTFSDRTVGEDAGISDLAESITYLSLLIEGEVDELVKLGVEREEARRRVVVGGFSSGAALAVLGSLSGVWEGTGSVVGLSGWLPFRRQIEEVVEQNRELGVEEREGTVEVYVRGLLGLDEEQHVTTVRRGKVLLCHGAMDVKMKHDWGLEMRKTLQGIGMQVEWKSHPELEHWLCGEEMLDVIKFLEGIWEGS
ncbi:alpha/beta-hydrolase [Stipitochalara longipes BDJ]|nr:alpha/beta-hydrolase [Stipitochalara longipes BDJ]